MGQEYRKEDEATRSGLIGEFSCFITKATLIAPCPVHTCNYHVAQSRQLGLNPTSDTHCIAEDFQREYDDTLDYAIRESGRVGYRDLEYLAVFFKKDADFLKVLYESGVEQARKIMLIQYYSMEVDFDKTCKVCGRHKCNGLADDYVCQTIDHMIDDIRPILNQMLTSAQIYACIWYDVRNKQQLFRAEEYERLKGLHNA